MVTVIGTILKVKFHYNFMILQWNLLFLSEIHSFEVKIWERSEIKNGKKIEIDWQVSMRRWYHYACRKCIVACSTAWWW